MKSQIKNKKNRRINFCYYYYQYNEFFLMNILNGRAIDQIMPRWWKSFMKQFIYPKG